MKKRTKTETELKTIGDLKPAEFNPRTITADALGGLTASVTEVGDISGIVYNLRLGCLVAGHQRVAAIRTEMGTTLDGQTVRKFPTPRKVEGQPRETLFA